jgi:S-phase kinase-associated protein 1
MEELVPFEFAKFMDIPDLELFALLNAAHYMDIQPLVDLGCLKCATIVKGKTPEQIRERFNWKDDFTEEEKLKKAAEVELVFGKKEEGTTTSSSSTSSSSS